jgi:hypothetical protein
MRAFPESRESRRIRSRPQDYRRRAHTQIVPILQKDIALLQLARLLSRIMTGQELKMQHVGRLALDAQDLICGAGDGGDVSVNQTRGRLRQPS